jgi:hypothetical protein
VADRASTWEGVRLCTEGITHFVFSEVSLPALESDGGFGADRLIRELLDVLDGWADATAPDERPALATSETGWRRHSVDGRTVRVQPGGARHA